jgi:hypothetical protein
VYPDSTLVPKALVLQAQAQAELGDRAGADAAVAQLVQLHADSASVDAARGFAASVK